MNIDTKAAASDIKRLLVKLREHDILLDPSTLPEALFLQVIEDCEIKDIPELEDERPNSYFLDLPKEVKEKYRNIT